MSGWGQEIATGFRRLVRNPGFSAVAILCLGLCIGANSAAFSFMNELFFRPLPVPEADRLVRLYMTYTSGLRWGAFSHPDYVDYRDQNTVFSGLILERATPFSLDVEGRQERLWGALVSENYFSVLEVEAARGRALSASAPGSPPVLVLSHGLWQRRFGGDPGVVGRALNLNGHPFVVAGVAPRWFHGTSIGFSPELWAPATRDAPLLPGDDPFSERGSRSFLALGRLKPGVSLEQAAAAMNQLARQAAETFPETNRGTSLTLVPEREGALHPSLRASVLAFFTVLQVVVVLVLMVACANVAALLLVRTQGRRREIGIRLAVGAGRARLVRQLLTENLLLALAGGGAGLLLAFWIIRAIRTFNPTSLPIFLELGLDGRVLGFTLMLSLLTVLVFGLAPALQGSRLDLVTTLKSGGAAVGGHRQGRLRSLLVGAQILVSVILLIVAGLFLRSLQQAETVDAGFEIDDVLVASLDLGLQGYDEERGRILYQQLTRRLDGLAGTRAVTFAETLPFNLFGRTTSVSPEGYELPDGSDPIVDYNVVAPGYFATLDLPLAVGRDFTERDDGEAPRVAIVNQTLARRFWPGQDPLGKALWPDCRVVGVAKDAKYSSLAEKPKPFVYLPLYQVYRPAMIAHLRTQGAPEALIPAIRQEVRALDPGLPVYDVRPLAEQLGMALLPARMGATLFSLFGALALLLAVVGLYGVVSYAVSQRTREIGLRLALGADGRSIVGLVVRQGMRIFAISLAVGVAASLLLARFLETLLHGVHPLDPLTFLAIPTLLGASALLATFAAARRAARVDPVVVLREE